MKYLPHLSNLVIMVAFCLSTVQIFAQEDFYYSRGSKIHLGISSEQISIKFVSGITEIQIQTVISSEPVLGVLKSLGPAISQGFFKVSLDSSTNVKLLAQRMKNIPEVDFVSPVYVLDGLEAIPFDQFIIQFKPSVTRSQIDALNSQHNVEVVSVSTASLNLYTLRITPASDLFVLEMAKLYYENIAAEWSLPDFIVPIELYDAPNDTYFDNQYYLHNTGQTGGVANADIDALEAWNISTGSSNITVAVIDQGTEAHEDLPSERLVAGYDYFYHDTDPSPGGNEAHGMTTAGIVAASQDNNAGITGVAPNCKIMPIRIFDDWRTGTTHGDVANAIDFAWQNGADVISNSWGYDIPLNNYFPDIVDAINRALIQGRDGNGCVVVFAAGNTANRNAGNNGYVAFPANVSGVLTVGATDKSNNIQNYSPQDSELDVVAPSGDIGYLIGSPVCSGGPHFQIELRGDVWSLDIGAQPGYNSGDFGICPPTNYNEYIWNAPGGDTYPPGNYTAHFGGTSASCPQAAGVAALILSIPDFSTLSYTQVTDIIKKSAVDMGSSGYDSDFGHGRLNAFYAVAPPSTPTNFYGTGSHGQNPTLHFDHVVEPDIDHLELHRTVIGQGGGNTVFTIAANSTQFTDNTVIIDKFSRIVILYKLKSVDVSDQESGFTNTVSYRGEGLWKQMA